MAEPRPVLTDFYLKISKFGHQVCMSNSDCAHIHQVYFILVLAKYFVGWRAKEFFGGWEIISQALLATSLINIMFVPYYEYFDSGLPKKDIQKYIKTF